MNSKYEKADKILSDMVIAYKNRLDVILNEDANSPEVLSLEHEINSLTYALKCLDSWTDLMEEGSFYQEDNDVHIIVPNVDLELNIVKGDSEDVFCKSNF